MTLSKTGPAETPTGVDDHVAAWQPYRVGKSVVADLDTRVHVWRVGLDTVAPTIHAALSDEERARADRFARPRDRRRFQAARGVLRAILADLLATGDSPKGRRLRFRYGPAGKPFLADDPALGFNVSHSEGLALIAVTRAGEVGIDVESHRGLPDTGAIAGLAFNAAERAALLRCPAAAREAVFYRIWTHKEALLKAMGTGLAGLEDRHAVSLADASAAWRITTLPHLDGFSAALAHPRAARGFRLWSWPDDPGGREDEARARR